MTPSGVASNESLSITRPSSNGKYPCNRYTCKSITKCISNNKAGKCNVGKTALS